MFKYSSLTAIEKAKICNGCGGKAGWIKVPEFLFHASCDHHDFLYWAGGTEEDRKRADLSFYRWMKKDANNSARKSVLKRGYNRAVAFVYYSAVRLGGKKFFYYGDRKTREDLNEEINGMARGEFSADEKVNCSDNNFCMGRCSSGCGGA